MSQKDRRVLPAIRTHQWLDAWSEINWSEAEHATEPPHWFYIFSMRASHLKALSGIYPRTTNRKKSSEDLGIQRQHVKARSSEIQRFVQYGYPWSELSETKRKSKDFADLQQPGWLPTAIVVNILTPQDERKKNRVHPHDLVTVTDKENGLSEIAVPESAFESDWRYSQAAPIEVIDGQHRLWAFDDIDLKGDFDLPVVAFVGLDLRWQAYLFYTINIKPKRINASLAFDLYPLLRTQEWLTKFEGHVIYRETRAQELVDILWSHRDSAWHHHINMLGESGQKGRMVTQAAWIRSLLASFIKKWEGPGVRIGGLFGSAIKSTDQVLPWNRAEQASVLMLIGQRVQSALTEEALAWADDIREEATVEDSEFHADKPVPFLGKYCLLNQDQGLRVLLQVYNDFLFENAEGLGLFQWGGEFSLSELSDEDVGRSLKSLENQRSIVKFVEELAESLVGFDWRSSDAPGLSREEKQDKSAYRGGGGYKLLKENVLRFLERAGTKTISRTAEDLCKSYGIE